MGVVPHQTAAKKEWLPACLAHMWSSRAHTWGADSAVEIVSEVGYCLQNVILDSNQPFVNFHLQVTAEDSQF